MTPEDMALQLERTGLCVWTDFLSPAALAATRDDLDDLRAHDGFTLAGTGKGRDSGGLVRRDQIHWLEREGANVVQAALWAQLDALKVALNRTLFLGLDSFEGHYAAYPVGGFYRRHLDCFREDDDRRVSVIVYLNRDWVSADGGRLRVHEGDSHFDVDPVGGTLACFMSRVSEHEVLESFRERFSLAGWFKVRGR